MARDTETRGDQALHGDIVLGLETDPGHETRTVAHFQQVPAAAGAAGFPGIGSQLCQIHRSAGQRQWMTGGQRDEDLVIEQVAGDEEVEVLLAARHVGPRIGEGDSEVAVAGPQCGARFGRFGFREGHRDTGKAIAHQRQRLGHQGRRGRGESSEPHATRSKARYGRHLLFGGVERAEHRAGVASQSQPSLSQSHGAPHPIHQRGARPLLESAHHLGDRRLGVAQRRGRPGEAALVGDRPHHAESRCIDHQRSIT